MSNKKEPQEQPITDISIYVAALQVTYRPASAPAEATNQVFEALHQAGFDFCNRPGSQGLSFKWMFKER